MVELISIHSPHTRGDRGNGGCQVMLIDISIHSPHTRGDNSDGVQSLSAMSFQSTPLTRGETFKKGVNDMYVIFQSTPLTRGETLWRSAPQAPNTISIHSPHTRGDGTDHVEHDDGKNFNPLPSHEGRRRHPCCQTDGDAFQSTPLTRGETAVAIVYASID